MRIQYITQLYFLLLGRGKTTLIRDIIRNISNGIKVIGFKGKNIGVVDERGEIAAMYKGVPQNDLGERTDILDNVSKAIRYENANKVNESTCNSSG